MFSPLLRLAKYWWRQLLDDWMTLPFARGLIFTQLVAFLIGFTSAVFTLLSQSAIMFPSLSAFGWILFFAAEFERVLTRHYLKSNLENEP